MLALQTFPADAPWPIMQGDPFWEEYLHCVSGQHAGTIGVHLAILVNPYLQLLLDGVKTVESRFSIHRRAPYKQVDVGDIVLLKRTGGPVVGIGYVAQTRFYQLVPGMLQQIQDEFAHELCVDDPQFWNERASATFATLVRLQHVRSIDPINVVKKDRRGWVVLQPRSAQLPLPQTVP